MLINFVTSTEEEWKGYFYMILLVGINLIKTILQSQYFYQLQLVGLRVRTSLISSIYRKSLVVGPEAKKNMTGKQTIQKVLQF